MNIEWFTRFLRTIKWLKLEQVVFRIWFALLRKVLHKSARSLKMPTDSVIAEIPDVTTQFLEYKCFDPLVLSTGQFKFLNISVVYGKFPDWYDINKSRLWRYNLHYFDYIRFKDESITSTGLDLIKNWIEKNPSGTLDAWDPFPTSLRIVNWIKFLALHEISGPDFQIISRSIHEQTQWLERFMERHLLANHLFKNLKALIFAGLFFKDKFGNRWLSESLRLLDRELDEQILLDGGHYEHSPMYHSMILEDCLDLLNVMNGSKRSELGGAEKKLSAVAEKMSRFLSVMCHPDGGIALFNDSAFGIEALPSDLISYFERLTGNSIHQRDDTCISLPASGYHIMSPTRGDRLFVDCGPIGPDYQPGHSHCDTLSIELSLKGKRVIVDSGCYGYEDGPMRQYNRGNAGHNTVTIDGENQSEVWASHRCARRAKPIYARLNEGDNELIFEGAHDGYKRLYGKPIHHRKITWRGNRIDIEDTIDGKGKHDFELRLHINPDLNLRIAGGEAMISDEASDIARIQTLPIGVVTAQDGWYCPEFGKRLPCDVLVNRHWKVQLPFKTGWTIYIS